MVTVINCCNSLPRAVVDSLSFKCFMSTLDNFQRDKPVPQTDEGNTEWGSLSGVCKKSDWMLITAPQSCTSNSSASARYFKGQSSHGHYTYPL